MSASQSTAGGPTGGHGAIAYNLAGIAVLVLLAAVGIAYFIDQAGRTIRPTAPQLDDGNELVQTIGGVDLAIPTSWFRHGEQIREGFASQADLAFALDLGEGVAREPVNVTVMPRSRARPSSVLLDTVYLHQFGEETLAGVPGLVGKPLLGRDGYLGETVWYDAISPSPFVAKCEAPVQDGLPGRCIRTLHLPSGLAVVISFEASALPAWKRFDAELGRWLGRIGAL